jgi:hypothetical protein
MMIKILIARLLNWMFPDDGKKYRSPIKRKAFLSKCDSEICGTYYVDEQNELAWFESEWTPEELVDDWLVLYGLGFNYYGKIEAQLTYLDPRSFQKVTASVYLAYLDHKSMCSWDTCGDKCLCFLKLKISPLLNNA